MSYVKKFLKELVIMETNYNLSRFGGTHDGGYALLTGAAFRHCPCLYSFGIADDIKFEKHFRFGFPDTRIKCFDPFIDALPEDAPDTFEFYKHGIGGMDGTPINVEQNSILKMDVETDEWEAFTHFRLQELNKFSQIACEFHIFHVETPPGLSPYFKKMYDRRIERQNEDIFFKFYSVIRKLKELFYIVHIHANNSMPKAVVSGQTIVPLLELTFVRKDLVVNKGTYRGGLPREGIDMPNKIDRPDIIVYYPFIPTED